MAKRLARRVPLLEKIKAYPLDVILAINEAAVSIDWDEYVHTTLPLGIALSTLFALLCKVADSNKGVRLRKANNLFRSDPSVYKQVRNRAITGSSDPIFYPAGSTESSNGGRWILLVHSLLAILIAASLINAIVVFFLSNRDYTLLNSSTQSSRPKASNVAKLSISNASGRGFFGKIVSYFEGTLHDYSDDSDEDTTYDVVVEKDVWVLRVWDPSFFQLHFAVTFCPLTLLAIRVVVLAAFWKLFLIILASSISLFGLVSKFLLLIGDKQIIYQETFNEYNRKYVIPHTSVLKKNAIVDATYGPMAASSMVAYDDARGHLQNENAFYTHDINGKRIKGVRADKQFASRSASPSRENHHRSQILNPYSRQKDTSFADLYTSARDRYNEDAYQSWLTLSTPLLNRTGHDEFIRPHSPRHSPLKTPTRLSFSQRTQLSPSRTSPTRNYFTPTHRGSPSPPRSSSPQRSSSPSKRPWQ